VPKNEGEISINLVFIYEKYSTIDRYFPSNEGSTISGTDQTRDE
jgi:hypothetical protein